MIKGVKSHHFCSSSVLSTLKRGEDIQGIAPREKDYGGCPRIHLTTVSYYNNVLNVSLWMPQRGRNWKFVSVVALLLLSKIQWEFVTVNFMYPLDWAMACPGIGSNIFWMCLWMCFWMRWACESWAGCNRLFSLMWCGSVVKNPPTSAGDMGSVPGSGRSPGKGNDNPLQYSCLGNPRDRGAWWATVHGVAKESDMS